MEKLTYEDFDLLVNAIEIWEKQPSTDGIMGAIFEVVMTKGANKEEAADKFSEQLEKGSSEVEKRKRQTILLKAKLVIMQTEIATQEVRDDLSEITKE